MTPAELEEMDRQRRDADRQYNDALTQFDAALVGTSPLATSGLVADSTPPPAPTGWRGWPVRAVLRWLAPWMDRQHTFNLQAAETVETLLRRDGERDAAFQRFQSTLIVFLQHITAFVDTKDRESTAHAATRIDEQRRVLAGLERRMEDTLPELRAQIAVLHRAMTTLKARPAESASAPAPVSATQGADRPSGKASDSMDDYKYVAFEDEFRGSDEGVAAKLADYLPIFAGKNDVVDLGCGRGEFLVALRSAGVRARGVDTNTSMVDAARERGLEVSNLDALGYIESLPDESIGGVIATQVVEHLEPSYLVRLLEALARTLRPGSPIVLETINPACWYAFFSSYIRDLTHVRPVHAETLQYLLRASGFERVEIRYRSPLPDHARLKPAYLPEELRRLDDPSAVTLTRFVDIANANTARLNELMFAAMDYAVVGYRA